MRAGNYSSVAQYKKKKGFLSSIENDSVRTSSQLVCNMDPSAGYHVFYQSSSLIICIGLIFVILVVTTWIISSKFVGVSTCLGPPYLYVTVEESSNVLKYSRDGCSITQHILWYGSFGSKHIGALRGLTLGSYKNSEALYLCDADNSQIIVHGKCSSFNKMRSYLSTVVSASNAPLNIGAQHPYAVTFDSVGNVYASFQHTDVVLRFQKDTFEPFDEPPRSLMTGSSNKYVNAFMVSDGTDTVPPIFPGTFAQFGLPGLHIHENQGIRGVKWITREISSDSSALNSSSIGVRALAEELWVANEDLNRIVILDKDAVEIAEITITNPIVLLFDPTREIMFVSSKNKKKKGGGGGVYGIDVHTRQVVKSFVMLGKAVLNHPTGLAMHGDVLFVGEQEKNVIMTFNITTQRYIREIVSTLPSKVEHVILSDC